MSKSTILLALLLTIALCQSVIDDEVKTGIPGYPHTVYSGTE